MLHVLAPDLWDLNASLAVLGMHLGHRMTVARLPGGGLWIHSPVAHTPALAAALGELGPVAHVVAPNRMHDTYLERWIDRYPDAAIHAAPGLAAQRPDLRFTAALDDAPPPAWRDVLDQHLVRGMPRLNEVVFLHRPSRTLILTDLAFNLGPEMPLLSRLLLKLNACDCRFAVSRMLKSTVKDRSAVRASVDHILAWDFDRIVVSHGENVERGGRAMLHEAFAFL